jgi:hypothetical protein
MKRAATAVALVVLMAGVARGQQGTGPSGHSDDPDVVIDSPPAKPADPTSAVVTAPGPAPDRNRPSADAGALEGVRALSVRDGEARLVIGGVERTIRPGDAIGADVVTGVAPERITLVRGASPSAPSGEATVVVAFDAQGRGRVRVYSLKHPSRPATPSFK